MISHFVVAFILFYVLATVYGMSAPSVTVDQVSAALVIPDDSVSGVPYEGAIDDEVISVDGVAFADVDPTTLPDGGTHTVVFVRDGVQATVETTDAVVPTPAYLSGLESGDVLLGIDGETVDDWEAFVALTQARPGEEVPMLLERDGEEIVLTTTLAVRQDEGVAVGFLGVAPELETNRSGPIEGLGVAAEDLATATVQSVQGLGSLVTNFGSIVGAVFGQDDAILDEVRPVSAIGLTRVADSVEITLALLAFVNVFVGVLNVVPLYPLDGGHFAVALYERIRGRAADVRRLIPLAAAVWIFIIALGLLGIYLDIVDPLDLPG